MTEKILGANGVGLRKQKRVPTLVYVRYLDHVLFKDVDPADFSNPFVRETLGWLAAENDKAIQILWEREAERSADPRIKQKATGLVILRADILEMKPLNENFFNKINQNIHDVYGKGPRGNNNNTGSKADPGPIAGVRKEGGHLRRHNLETHGRGGKT